MKHKISLLAALTLGLLAFNGVLAEKSDSKKEMGTVIGIDLGTTYSW